MNSSEEGRHEELHGVNLLCNPEKYVDTGYQLKQLKIEMNRALKDEVKIWTHINASVSKEFYHVYQDWEWLNTEQLHPRTYSFMGLYRKFSESDLFELMRLKQLIREGKAIQQIESDSLFATFQGNSIFSVFFREVKIMRQILEWLESDEFPKELDEDENEIENQALRRVFCILSRHMIGEP